MSTNLIKNQQTESISEDEIKNEIEKLMEDESFPVDVFPSPFLELIQETNRTLNFPCDYTGTAILTAVATAIGKSCQIKVKKGWYEFPAIFAAIIGKPGANKSHPIEMAFKPFAAIDKTQIEKFENEYKEFENYQSLSKKDKELQPPIKPKLSKIVLHNFSSEILHHRLADNDRGCAIVSDELATFLNNMNNYSKGDQASIYLSFWSNKPTSIDRVSKPVPLWLPQPFLNIIGSIQPRVLPKLFANRIENGFLQRFLFSFPYNVEKQPINDFEIDEKLFGKYSEWIYDNLSENPITFIDGDGLAETKIFSWSKDAKVFFYEWQKENTTQVNENNDSLKGEILSKFDIHFCRLSLILQIMEDSTCNEISLNAAMGAAKLCTYFLSSSFKVLELLNKNKTDELPQDKRQLFEALPDEFTTGEGLLIAEDLGIPERTYKRFITQDEFFKKLKVGKYEKRK